MENSGTNGRDQPSNDRKFSSPIYPGGFPGAANRRNQLICSRNNHLNDRLRLSTNGFALHHL